MYWSFLERTYKETKWKRCSVCLINAVALEIEEILKAFKNCKGFKLNLSNVNFIHVEWALNVVTSLF